MTWYIGQSFLPSWERSCIRRRARDRDRPVKWEKEIRGKYIRSCHRQPILMSDIYSNAGCKNRRNTTDRADGAGGKWETGWQEEELDRRSRASGLRTTHNTSCFRSQRTDIRLQLAEQTKMKEVIDARTEIRNDSLSFLDCSSPTHSVHPLLYIIVHITSITPCFYQWIVNEAEH